MLYRTEDTLTMLARSGSQAGGARPKLIVSEKRAKGSRFWLVKFNRFADPFNYARLEWACLELCRLAGLPVPAAECMTLPSGRTALKGLISTALAMTIRRCQKGNLKLSK
jgi:hypothetical protein